MIFESKRFPGVSPECFKKPIPVKKPTIQGAYVSPGFFYNFIVQEDDVGHVFNDSIRALALCRVS